MAKRKFVEPDEVYIVVRKTNAIVGELPPFRTRNHAEGRAKLSDMERVVGPFRKDSASPFREELQFIKSYLSHQDQDADHGFIVRRINDVLAGKDPSPEITKALEEMHDEKKSTQPKMCGHPSYVGGCAYCMWRAGPEPEPVQWCEKHPKPTGPGKMRCPTCSIESLENALNRICRAIDAYVGGATNPDDPNYCTYYEATYNADAVAERVERLITDFKKEKTDGTKGAAGVRPVDEGSGRSEEVGRPVVGARVQATRAGGQGSSGEGGGDVDVYAENMSFLREFAPAATPLASHTGPMGTLEGEAHPADVSETVLAEAERYTLTCISESREPLPFNGRYLLSMVRELRRHRQGAVSAEVAGFMSGLHEVKNFISFMMRSGTGEDFTHGYNQALQDLSEFIRKQETYEGKELLKYETRSSDGERVLKDRWETAIRNIAHNFFGPTGSWEIEDVVEEVWKLNQQVKRDKLEADKLREEMKAIPDPYPNDEAAYGRKAGMNRAPNDLPDANRAAWLRHEVSAFGQTKIYQPQYEELRVHAADLWKKLKNIKEALKS